MSEIILCRERYDWIKETPVWWAKLSNGELIYEWDNQPGAEERSTWRRLRKYCIQNTLKIHQLGCSYWDNHLSIKEGAAGFTFSLGAGGWLNSSEPAAKHFVLGYLEDGKIHKSTIKSPELIILETRIVDFDPESENFWWGTGSDIILNTPDWEPSYV